MKTILQFNKIQIELPCVKLYLLYVMTFHFNNKILYRGINNSTSTSPAHLSEAVVFQNNKTKQKKQTNYLLLKKESVLKISIKF